MSARLQRALQVCVILGLGGLSSANATTLVLVPQGERSAALRSILGGIRDATEDVDIRSTDPATSSLEPGATDRDYDAVILLGKELLGERSVLPDDVPILLGGFTGSLEDVPGLKRISLNIDPRYVLDQIDKTGPSITRIRTTLPPESITNPEIVRLSALEGVETKHMAFASGERATARAWFEALQAVEGPEDALWIVDDTHLDSSGTYRYLTETAWRTDTLIVSSIPSYARRGVAIGFIPDLPAYGELLVRSVRRMIDDARYTPEPLLGADTVQRVFNRRTLEHVGRRLPDDLDRLGRDDIILE